MFKSVFSMQKQQILLQKGGVGSGVRGHQTEASQSSATPQWGQGIKEGLDVETDGGGKGRVESIDGDMAIVNLGGTQMEFELGSLRPRIQKGGEGSGIKGHTTPAQHADKAGKEMNGALKDYMQHFKDDGAQADELKEIKENDDFYSSLKYSIDDMKESMATLSAGHSDEAVSSIESTIAELRAESKDTENEQYGGNVAHSFGRAADAGEAFLNGYRSVVGKK